MLTLAAPILPPLAPGLDRITAQNFDRLASYIYTYAGIKMPPSKKTMLEGRLRRRQRAVNAETLNEYCEYLFSDSNIDREGEYLINAVTTNKTDFFREPQHFDYLRNVALPELVARGPQTIRAWSVACSTGPEPYTIAMVIDDFAAGRFNLAYNILATDLDTDVLEVARTGIYPAEIADPIPPLIRRKYVMGSRDPERSEIRIAPALRRNVGFARLNLMEDHYPVGDPMDLIFCRNVLIYFDRPTQNRVVAQIVEQLAPGGLLFLGHSESIAGHDLPIVQVANTIFKRS